MLVLFEFAITIPFFLIIPNCHDSKLILTHSCSFLRPLSIGPGLEQKQIKMEMKCGLILLLIGLTWADSERPNSVHQPEGKSVK